MAIDDEINNEATDLGGRTRAAVGGATGDEDLTAEGRADQAKARLQEAKDKVEDVFKKD